MEFTNELLLHGVTYCFEDDDQVVKAHAWINAHAPDTEQFRTVFPDARPVSTCPYGSARQPGH